MTNEEIRNAWAALTRSVRTGVLFTLRAGRPFGSHVLYLFGSDWTRVYLHLSRLAQHTQHLLVAPHVSLFISEPDGPEKNPLLLKRLNLQGTAAVLPPDAPIYAAIKKQYLDKFPGSTPMFGFGDFSLWELTLEDAHLILGFGQAFLSTRTNPHNWIHQRPEQKAPTGN